VDVAGKREAHDAGVIKDHDDDGERAEKIEAGLTLAVLKARIDSGTERRCSFSRGLRNGRSLAERVQTLKALAETSGRMGALLRSSGAVAARMEDR
jgi:hypothetical protein